MARLLEKYKNEIRNNLKSVLNKKSVMDVPALVKIVINMGVGQGAQDKSIIDDAEGALTKIAGQKPLRCKAKKAIAGFKLREGQVIGLKVTLRGKRMYEFLDRLISVALPAVKDFRGLSKKMDGKGNYTLGWKEHAIFPEINLDSVKNNFGMDICFTTTANNDEDSLKLLMELGLPFRK